MNATDFAGRITDLSNKRDKLSAQRVDLENEKAQARQQADVDELVKVNSAIDKIDDKLNAVTELLDDENEGMSTAIASLKEIVRDNERDHNKAKRDTLAELLKTPAANEARLLLGAVATLLHEINPMLDFMESDALRDLMRMSSEERDAGFHQHVQMPEEKPDPPELAILLNAQRLMRESGTHTIVTAGSEPRANTRTHFQASAADIANAREERKRRLELKDSSDTAGIA